MLRSSFVLMNVAFIFDASAISIDFLKSVQRFETHFMDYYFSCNIEGQTLQWEVNDIRLGGFDVGSPKAWTSSKFGINYTAALLSSDLTAAGYNTFDSVLVISVLNDSRLDVVCRSESMQNKTSNEVDPLVDEMNAKQSNPTIFLEYILTGRIIQNFENLLTSIFICGVENVYQTWQVNGPRYGFDTTSRIGQDRVQSENSATVGELAVLVAREPYQIVTILFVTDSSNVTVTCASGEQQEQLLAPVLTASRTSTLPLPHLGSTSVGDEAHTEPVTETTFLAGLTTVHETENISMGILAALGAAVAVCVGIFVIFAIALSLAIYKFRKVTVLKCEESGGESPKCAYILKDEPEKSLSNVKNIPECEPENPSSEFLSYVDRT